MTELYLGLSQQQFKKNNTFNGKSITEKANVRIDGGLGEVVFNNIDVLSLVVEKGTSLKATGSIKVQSFIIVEEGQLMSLGSIDTHGDIKVGGNLSSRGIIAANGFIDVSGKIYSSIMTKAGKSIFADAIKCDGVIECHRDMWITNNIISVGGILSYGRISAKEISGGNGHYVICQELIKGNILSGELVIRS